VATHGHSTSNSLGLGCFPLVEFGVTMHRSRTSALPSGVWWPTTVVFLAMVFRWSEPEMGGEPAAISLNELVVSGGGLHRPLLP
jgi:hypothetical protein